MELWGQVMQRLDPNGRGKINYAAFEKEMEYNGLQLESESLTDEEQYAQYQKVKEEV